MISGKMKEDFKILKIAMDFQNNSDFHDLRPNLS